MALRWRRTFFWLGERHSLPCEDAVRLSRRWIRSRRSSFNTEALRLADDGMPENSSQRAPPTTMPLSYIKGEIAGLEKYRTDDVLWGKETLREAWRAHHHSLQLALDMEDTLRAQQLVDKDLVGLALCTSYAEVKYLLSMFSPSLRTAVVSHPLFVHAEVEEFFLHLGQEIEVRGGGWVLQLPSPTVTELQFTIDKVGRFGDDGRGCIRNTPHRVAVWRGRLGEPLGLTVRVGRYVPNVARALVPLARKGSLLIISKAGVGKTTLLRDLSASLSREPLKPRVMVVDTSNEIGGDNPIPLPFLGRCRRIQVPSREEQQRVMTQVVQNHSPEYVIVDEISSASEAEAAWSISKRGVHLIASCHGENLAGLLQNQSLNLLVGGAAQAFLSNEERRLRNKLKKTVLERPHSSPFRFVVELTTRTAAHVYVDVNAAVDLLLDDQDAKQNASVGRTIALDRPLSEDFMAILLSKERPARTGPAEADDVDTDDCGHWRKTMGARWCEGKGKKRSGGARRTDDEHLLEELQQFL